MTSISKSFYVITLMDDKGLVKGILSGDQSCWKEFVERYTNWVLYTAWEFERKFCYLPAKSVNCSLRLILRQRKGKEARYLPDSEDCDEGLELYLWLFQQLRKRLKYYRGESKLSTYIWTILNSRALHVDILRWKYGRVDEGNPQRLPVAIRRLPELERKLFVLLRRSKDEESILRQLNIDRQTLQQATQRIREALSAAGQMDLIERPELKDFEPWDGETERQLWHWGLLREQEATLTDRLFCRQVVDMVNEALKKLPPAERKLFRLYYQEGLSGREIGRFCERLEPPLEINGVKVDTRNVYYLLGKVSERVILAMELEVDGRKLTRKQWLEVLSVIGREGLW